MKCCYSIDHFLCSDQSPSHHSKLHTQVQCINSYVQITVFYRFFPKIPPADTRKNATILQSTTTISMVIVSILGHLFTYIKCDHSTAATSYFNGGPVWSSDIGFAHTSAMLKAERARGNPWEILPIKSQAQFHLIILDKYIDSSCPPDAAPNSKLYDWPLWRIASNTTFLSICIYLAPSSQQCIRCESNGGDSSTRNGTAISPSNNKHLSVTAAH